MVETRRHRPSDEVAEACSTGELEATVATCRSVATPLGPPWLRLAREYKAEKQVVVVAAAVEQGKDGAEVQCAATRGELKADTTIPGTRTRHGVTGGERDTPLRPSNEEALELRVQRPRTPGSLSRRLGEQTEA